MTIFEWINQILVHKKPWDSFNETDQKTFSPFIINRWLSMDEEFIEVVNYFQKYAIGTVEPREVYKWYCDVLPEGKNFGDVKEAETIDPQKIDQAKLVPLLTAALQEAITKIETLEAKVAVLEG